MFQAPISRKGFIKLGGTLFGSFGTSTEPKKGHFGPKWALLRPPGNLGEAGYQAKVCGDHESYPGGPIGGSWDQIWSPRAPSGPPKSPKGAFWAKMGSFRAPGGPEGDHYHVKLCGDHESSPGRPIVGNWDQIWSSGALRGPLGTPQGCFGA